MFTRSHTLSRRIRTALVPHNVCNTNHRDQCGCVTNGQVGLFGTVGWQARLVSRQGLAGWLAGWVAWPGGLAGSIVGGQWIFEVRNFLKWRQLR